MPVPVSVTSMQTYSPGDNAGASALSPSKLTLAVEITSLPPSGIASRALIARLSSALSSWLGSHSVFHRSSAATMARSIVSPMVRRSRSSSDTTSWLASTLFGTSGWRRAKAKQAMRQRRGAVGRGHRRIDIARNVVEPALIEPGLHQVERSDDAGQQIVEVVRDAAGQLADGFHLLRLQQRLFGRAQSLGRGLFRGDVARHRIDVIAGPAPRSMTASDKSHPCGECGFQTARWPRCRGASRPARA